VVRITVDFRKPARVDDALHVRTVYERIRGPRLFIRQRIVRREDLIATAEVEAACIDLTGRPRKPPPGLVSALEPLFSTAP
jgi:acyl-CoA thioester hydrolase